LRGARGRSHKRIACIRDVAHFSTRAAWASGMAATAGELG
jgi:hypothetical protein